MPLGPSFKLGHALEAGLFVHARSLEVIAGYPNLANTSTARLGDESIQQCARVTASSICLIDQAGVYRCLVLAVRRKAEYNWARLSPIAGAGNRSSMNLA